MSTCTGFGSIAILLLTLNALRPVRAAEPEPNKTTPVMDVLDKLPPRYFVWVA